MNHSSRNRHRTTTRWVTHRSSNGLGIEKFVRNTRSYRIVKIEADNQTRTAADPLSNAA